MQYSISFPSPCNATCSGDSTEICGTTTSDYYSVYSRGKIWFFFEMKNNWHLFEFFFLTNSLLRAAYLSVGCYAANNSCVSDVFVETLAPAQCSNALSSYPLFINASSCSYHGIGSTSGMTIEKCLQICTTNGFKYAGLRT
jgi:hypothetical protein